MYVRMSIGICMYVTNLSNSLQLTAANGKCQRLKLLFTVIRRLEQQVDPFTWIVFFFFNFIFGFLFLFLLLLYIALVVFIVVVCFSPLFFDFFYYCTFFFTHMQTNNFVRKHTCTYICIGMYWYVFVCTHACKPFFCVLRLLLLLVTLTSS